VVVCLKQGADLHMAQLMPPHSLSLASVKSRLVLPFWYRLTWVVPEKGPLNGTVCVCNSCCYVGCPSYNGCTTIIVVAGIALRLSTVVMQQQSSKKHIRVIGDVTSPPVGEAKYCDDSVRLSVRENTCGTTIPIFTIFLCMLAMFVARSSSGGVVICYVLAVL